MDHDAGVFVALRMTVSGDMLSRIEDLDLMTRLGQFTANDCTPTIPILPLARIRRRSSPVLRYSEVKGCYAASALRISSS
jgi:hypothetical protein